EQVDVLLALMQQQCDEHVDDQVDPAEALVQVRVAQVDQPIAQGGAGQQGEEESQYHPLDIVNTQYFRALGVNRIRCAGPHRDARCSSPMCCPGTGPGSPGAATDTGRSGPCGGPRGSRGGAMRPWPP